MDSFCILCMSLRKFRFQFVSYTPFTLDTIHSVGWTRKWRGKKIRRKEREKKKYTHRSQSVVVGSYFAINEKVNWAKVTFFFLLSFLLGHFHGSRAETFGFTDEWYSGYWKGCILLLILYVKWVFFYFFNFLFTQ